MGTDGISTNRLKKNVSNTIQFFYSKSTVSQMTQELNPQIIKWQEEKLKVHYDCFFTDSFYSLLRFFLRGSNQAISRPALITFGVDKTGNRFILGQVCCTLSYSLFLVITIL
jgi:transposase-like protein